MSKPLNRGARLLREWRERAGLTQFQAAVELGIDPSPLSKFERGRRLPGFTTIKKIAEKTQGFVTVDAWAEEEEAETPAAVG